MLVQPSDWYQHDITINKRRQYVVDVFGRADDERVVCVRIVGFKPYFYSLKPITDDAMTSKQVFKHDVMAGFADLKPKRVWKVECDTLNAFHEGIRAARDTKGQQLYESNLPPFMRMFHERHLSPASPIRVSYAEELDIPADKDTEEPKYHVEAYYEAEVQNVESAPGETIPQLVASYDLEMYSASGLFPQASKDPIIQIGISYRWTDDLLTPVARTVYVNGTVDPSDEPGTTFVGCTNESEMLLKFAQDIKMNNPDIMCGYNTFGFDDAYIEDRCKRLGILSQMELARCPTVGKEDGRFITRFAESKKFELASGKYDLRFLILRGRLGLDLLLNMRREHSLDSFKLDNVASVFLRDRVVSYKDGRVYTNSTRGLRNGNYVKFDLVGHTTDPYREGHKFVVSDVQGKSFRIEGAPDLFYDLDDKQKKSLEWTFTKDDVEPAELFRLHRGSSADRARIAKYCIQDCDLVLTLMAKLDTLVNARGMADVCKVPMEYVLRRGQGIKIFSAVVYYAAQRDQIIQTQEFHGDGEDGYEGAIVLPPKIGMYLDQPISVLDFNSLYPSNMIAYNLSPDTLVCERTFDAEGHKTSHYGLKVEEMKALEEKGYILEEVEYDQKDDKDVVVGRTVCTFVQPQPEIPMTVGILPKTLDILLKKRKEFKDKMEDPSYDEAQRSVYNGLQLAYKVVANSVYGQTGSKTSPIRKMCVAACTTAAGRKQLNFAKKVVETEFGAEVVYGDTDSIFVKFPTKDLAESIKLGIASGNRITEQCKRPYKIAYEKTFYPFILFCRKRYVGMMYETNPDPAKAKRKSMGIVLKRRDNAPIVKDVFGGALDILMQERDVKKAQAFTNDMLMKVMQNEIPIEKFIVSKSLRDDYVTEVPKAIRDHHNPQKEKHASLNQPKASYHIIRKYAEDNHLPLPVSSLAHRVLADRMTSRDPGTAPKVGDRIQYIYVAENAKAAKQGDRIEEVGYVRKNGLHPDNVFYITNQIQNPVASLFALCIEELDGYVRPRSPSYGTLFKECMEKYRDEEEAMLAVLAKKEKQLDSLMFTASPALSSLIRKQGHKLVKGPMDAFLRK